jgi:cytochrome c
MDQWLANPRRMVPGTTMAFAGLADPKDRADVIAYLATQRP